MFLNSLRSETPKWIILILWILANIGMFIGFFVKYQVSDEYFYLRKIVGINLAVARASASCLNLNCTLLLLPVCRNLISFWRVSCQRCKTNVRRQLDNNIIFHKFIAYAICLFTAMHYYSHTVNFERFIDAHHQEGLLSKLSNLGNAKNQTYINPIRSPNTNPMLELVKCVAGITGVIMTMALVIIVSSSTQLIRRSYFEAFWFTHHLFVLFYIFLVTHGLGGMVRKQSNVAQHDPEKCQNLLWGGANSKNCPVPQFEPPGVSSWKWVIGPICLYLLERFLRFLKSLRPVNIFEVIQHPSKVIEIRLHKEKLDPMPGEYVLLKCMEISKLEWHPFTLTSAPDDNYLSVHIRVAGDWTEKLYEICTAERRQKPKLAIDGPFGTATEDVFRYQVDVMIGAGIGITPFASVLKHIWHKLQQSSEKPIKLRKVHFFWICGSTASFEWFRELLSDLELKIRNSGSPDFLSYHVYLTRGWDNRMARDIVSRDRESKDPLTGLSQKTFFGRPEWPKLFQSFLHDHPGVKIGVFCCAPSGLVKEVNKCCQDYSSSNEQNTEFIFNTEHF
ncbi:DgyrCDS6183 [Dimorphilus gyrociliatus]|uniref:DgyrCDS6183 n=1 Tax=Dimorphilus gyrociliatus TaxID=2664684 RepID=A0A7I8VN38_9ANNE|nr:DgyrCDS6183 [Dimorphilus gyrociliatus]